MILPNSISMMKDYVKQPLHHVEDWTLRAYSDLTKKNLKNSPQKKIQCEHSLRSLLAMGGVLTVIKPLCFIREDFLSSNIVIFWCCASSSLNIWIPFWHTCGPLNTANTDTLLNQFINYNHIITHSELLWITRVYTSLDIMLTVFSLHIYECIISW